MNLKFSIYFKGFLLLLLTSVLSACSSSQVIGGAQAKQQSQTSSNWQEEVSELNQKITILSRWQQGYRMTAQQAQFKADRIQFQQDNLIDAKRLWKVAENASQKAQDLQVIINKLVEQRNALLTKHGQPIPRNAGFENKNSIDEQSS